MKIKKLLGGCPKGKRLTKIDHEILAKIARLGFQNYKELRAGPLKKFSRQHSWGSMKKLVDMELIAVKFGDGGDILGWTLDQAGKKLFENYKADPAWAITSRPPSYRTSYKHDQVLREVQALLETSPVIQKWVPEQKLRQAIMQRYFYMHANDKSEKVGLLPDALLHLKTTDRTSIAALELELTQKSRRRLLQKFETHILHPNYNFVFYIIEGDRLLRTLWSIYREVQEKSIRVKIAKKQNGIFFATLSDVRNLKLSAKFKGIESSFSFQDLASKA